MAQKDLEDLTRERLLDEAELLFSTKGYHAVSIREITKAADCNLAAVSYHFSNKQSLYMEVFRSRWIPRAKRINKFFKKNLTDHGSISLSTVVHTLVQAILAGPLADEERQRHYQLITRELCQPTKAFDLLVEEAIRPLFKDLFNAFRQCLPTNIENEELALNILNIFGMMFYFSFACEAITRVIGREYDPHFNTQFINNIIKFSLHGLHVNVEEA